MTQRYIFFHNSEVRGGELKWYILLRFGPENWDIEDFNFVKAYLYLNMGFNKCLSTNFVKIMKTSL